MLVRGGIPIAKVRIDFSSVKLYKKFSRTKDYYWTMKIHLFLFNNIIHHAKFFAATTANNIMTKLQQTAYVKNNPVCFRCGQNHPYNPNCSNKICCANCKEEHLAGNPSCRVKIAERNKCKSILITSIGYQSNSIKITPTAWATTSNRIAISVCQPPTTATAPTALKNTNSFSSLEI